MANEKRLIDANALMEHLNRCIEQSKGLMKSVCVAIKCFVEQMPTVDAVEVVHGQWLDGFAVDHNGKKVYDSIDCSHCYEIFKIESYDREYWKNRFKVCPFCGAKMDGGNEDE